MPGSAATLCQNGVCIMTARNPRLKIRALELVSSCETSRSTHDDHAEVRRKLKQQVRTNCVRKRSVAYNANGMPQAFSTNCAARRPCVPHFEVCCFSTVLFLKPRKRYWSAWKQSKTCLAGGSSSRDAYKQLRRRLFVSCIRCKSPPAIIETTIRLPVQIACWNIVYI